MNTRARSIRPAIATAVTVLLAISGVSLGALPAYAAGTVLTVTSIDDVDGNDACNTPSVQSLDSNATLRNALCVANNIGGQVEVVVPAGEYILGSLGSLVVGTTPGSDITISGAGSADTIIRGSGSSQVMTLDINTVGGIAVSIDGVTIADGVDDLFGGGGIIAGSAIATTSDTLTITNSTFANNQTTVANAPGGAIQMAGGSLTISNTDFDGNSTVDGSHGGAVFYQAMGYYSGEALSITGSTFVNNSINGGATAVGGGAVAVDDVGTGTPASMSIDLSTFTGNKVLGTGDQGGAIYLNSGELNVKRSSFTENEGPDAATNAGSAIYAMAGSNLTANYNRIVGNTKASASVTVNDVADLGNNWWGCNGGPGAPGCGTASLPGGQTVASHLVFSASAAAPSILAPASNALSATLISSSSTNPTAAQLGGFASETVSWGVTAPPTSTVSTALSTFGASGQATTSFNPGTGRGAASVAASFDGVTVDIPFAINEAPGFSSAASVNAEVGTPMSFDIVATGYPVPTPSYGAGSDALPQGITATPQPGTGTVTLSGTPAAGSAGVYVLNLVAVNGVGLPANQTLTITVTDGARITSADSTTFTADQPGSFTITTSGNPAVSEITESGALPTGIAFTDNGDGTATIAGTATVPGAYPITLTASNGELPNATQTFTLKVNKVPTITSVDHVTFLSGVAEAFTITTSANYPNNPSFAIYGNRPSGIDFVPGAGGTLVLSGTVARGVGGDYPLRLVPSNPAGTGPTQDFTLTIHDAPLVTTSPSSALVIAGDSVTFTSAATGYPTPTVQWQESSNGTSWSDIAGETGASYTFTAASGDNGTQYRAVYSGAGAPAATAAATLSIATAPTFSSAAQTTWRADAGEQSFTVASTGTPVPTLSASSPLPAWLTLTDNGDGTATLSGNPTAAEAGIHSLAFGSANGFGTAASQSFALTVTLAPSVDVFVLPDAVVGVAYSATVTATAGFPTATTISANGLPSGLALTDNGDGTATIAGTPNPGSGGVAVVEVFASNGTGTPASRSGQLTVNEAVTLTSVDVAQFTRGVASTFAITTSPGYPAAVITMTSGTLPSGLFFSPTGVGTAQISGTPVAGTDGDYVIGLQAFNGFGTASVQTLHLRVSGTATFTSAGSTTFTAGTAGSFTVTATGTPAVSSMSYSGTLPSGVTFTDNGDGTATIAGTPSEIGDFVLQLGASNGTATDATQNFTLSVQKKPAITSGAAVSFTTGVAGTFTVTTSASHPLPVTIAAVGALPSGVSFSDNGDGTATLAGTPAAASGASYALSITASNAAGSSAVQNFVLTVNDAPVVTGSPVAVTTLAGLSVTFTSSASGYPAPAVQWQSSSNGTDWENISGATSPDYSFTASLGDSGNSFRAVYSNVAGTVATASALLTVGTTPAITSAGTLAWQAGSGAQQFTVTTSGTPDAVVSATSPLPGWLTLTPNGDGTATLSGTPTAAEAGVSTIALSATNGFGTNATQTLTLTVNLAPTANSFVLPTAEVGVAFSETVSATPGYPVATTLGASGLPSGLSLTDNGDGTATISGTPVAGSGGDYTVVVSASNGTGTPGTASGALTVTESPSFVSAASIQFLRGVDSGFTVVTTPGFPAATTLTLTGTLPAGLSFTDNGDGTATIAGTTTDAPASIALVFTASNGTTDVAQNFVLELVTAAAVPLPIVPPAADAALLGVPSESQRGQTFTVSGSGFAAGAPITLGMYSVPEALGTAIAADDGTFTATVTVPNDASSAQHTIAAVGVGANGDSRFVSALTLVKAPVVPPKPTPPGSGSLPSTGVPLDAGMLILLAFFTVGCGILLLSRRAVLGAAAHRPDQISSPRVPRHRG